MRLNRFLAQASGISRRQADQCIREGRVRVDGRSAQLGEQITPRMQITLDGQPVSLPNQTTTIMLHKPTGYIASRRQQGSTPTIYSLLPEELHDLKYIGRLDKDSRGLLLLSNDGELIQQYTHPKHEKNKIYHVTLNRPLDLSDLTALNEGVYLDDGLSRLETTVLHDNTYEVRIYEGRNRQIRRTFKVLGYEVTDLLRTELGEYSLDDLREGEYRILS